MPGTTACGLPIAIVLVAVALLNTSPVGGRAAAADASQSAADAAAPPSAGITQRPTWKTIRLGTVHSVIALREALESPGCGSARVAVARMSDRPSCHLGSDANEALGQRGFRLSADIRAVDLVQASAVDLGFAADATPGLAEIYARGEEAGLAICPTEVGPQLRLQYLNQPVGEFLPIAMAPLATYAGEPIIFLVGNGGAGLLLVGRSAAPDTHIPGFIEFVFCRPARQSAPAAPFLR